MKYDALWHSTVVEVCKQMGEASVNNFSGAQWVFGAPAFYRSLWQTLDICLQLPLSWKGLFIFTFIFQFVNKRANLQSRTFPLSKTKKMPQDQNSSNGCFSTVHQFFRIALSHYQSLSFTCTLRLLSPQSRYTFSKDFKGVQ
jgi:hypothetical protein